MVIELLKVKVPPKQREEYIQKDAEIWTTALAKYPGFLGKEVWINPDDDTEVILINRWATEEQWQAIPKLERQAIEQRFTQAMGKAYPIVLSAKYQVRKYLRS
ncbi:TIGR03792 family protein [Aetokthonos hydrillicola Thurmond2011]|uniref:TIGR03792 family protein n=1 Tax=Aetokthonos hydrillicola Thurmond2011 TaxID=2712845 RepID=A0AAP5MD32_9CYAN|nr:TIGR03792 family protein [Aetokthonos hydrillicola]MBO3461915.1 TIGR03792 family protein [Aetokthonos hydrillicola CCALA 1050]MBW4585420.1 TIGR03792 family protein [Aetokthonos hydrillicola CCALA 1050]MDR9899073.1 TIGR03792 family protein [Aetokthonos hydrillicola Thurmond2011]